MKSKPFSVADLIETLGGPTKAAEKLGISNPSVVLNWRARNSVPPNFVLRVEDLTGISRHVMRPDVFGPAKAPAKALAS